MDWIKDLSGFFLPFLDRVPVVRAALGFALVFFLPGFAWTLVLFRQAKVLERIVLSFALSVALVTLSMVGANQLFGLKITGLNSVLVILVITILPIAVFYLNRALRRRGQKMPEKTDTAA